MRSGAFEGCAAPHAADRSHLAPAAQELFSDNEPLMTPVVYGRDDAFGRTALLGGCPVLLGGCPDRAPSTLSIDIAQNASPRCARTCAKHFLIAAF